MAQDGTPLVELDGVRRTYRRGEEVVRALAGVSMTVREREFVVVTGPSGSGKSTLLHVMAGLDRPDEGDVKLEGTPLARMSDDDLTLYRRRRLGFIFQFFHLLPTLSAADNVALPLLLADEPTGNLDSESGRDVYRILRELDTAIVMVTHDRAATSLGDRTFEMRDGVLQ